MADASLQTARENMIESQVRTWDVLDQRVLDLMREIPREHFVPPRYRSLAYADTQVPLGHGQVMEPPKLIGHILQSTAPGRRDRVLEVGTGSGYLTACLTRLAREVDSVDIFPEFTAPAQARLDALGLTANLSTQDLARGPEAAEQRYDVIVVTGSLPCPHQGFHRALALNGRLFMVVGTLPIMEALLITRVGVDQWASESLLDTALPPLVNAPTPDPFHF
ncbi:MAG: protein-L-isoaspartate O-methyltransferase [Pseudomonadota bacterium]|nr:protein-L-isoaspartate O-methyltransferase [Pseudomonadota bacterium]HJO35190.1 protein-L-isoaspartate O-methyltransferase [Gammaproteobacteria bacterium]